ncbi:toxin-antitoxin system HicB family antitoxin [Actinomadura kijaniata]|uniref:toxin-antitoxin system HicB family antitoxin n=1 Tax=Actinomadura kijaniata TaxID=46161 RepID=UPI00082A0DBD|nr:toxin-antitoxin system HicB family antitoxin [Actinomadura kijaniata]
MNLSSYVESLRRELAVAAAAGGDEARALAERLVAPLDSTARLVLLEALSDAADEITRELVPGSVEVRLRGRDPEFVVRQPFTETGPPPAPMPPMPVPPAPGVPLPPVPPAPPAPPEPEDRGTARISLRVPEQLKPRIEEAARAEGISVNAWLVRAISGALDGASRFGSPHQHGGQSITGWAR